VYAEQKAGFKKEFEKMDLDGDGNLTQEEVLTFAWKAAL